MYPMTTKTGRVRCQECGEPSHAPGHPEAVHLFTYRRRNNGEIMSDKLLCGPCSRKPISRHIILEDRGE